MFCAIFLFILILRGSWSEEVAVYTREMSDVRLE